MDAGGEARCESCYDDKDETSQVQEKRFQEQRRRRTVLRPGLGGRWRSNVDRVLRARGKMMKNKANGPSDWLVTGMLHELPMQSLYEITHWLWKKIQERMSCPCSVDNSTLEKGVLGVWAIALVSVLAERYAAVMVGLLQAEPEPIEWKEFHVGAERRGQLRAHAA